MRILICSDGTPQAEGAVQMGALLGRAFVDCETTLVGISERDPSEMLSSLTGCQERLRAQGVEAALLSQPGDPVESIVKLTQERVFDLVVIGGSRQTGPLARPAKAYDLLRRVGTRVLLVGRPRPQIGRILVCTGGAYVAERAVRFTARLAHATGARVSLFHVMAEPPSLFAPMKNEEDVHSLLQSRSGLARALRRQCQQLEESGVAYELVVRYGLVVDRITAEIEEGDYDLVVTGTHPVDEGRLSLWMMGDMTRSIVEEVDRPILIVRTAERGENLIKLFKRLISSAFSRPREEAEPGTQAARTR